MIEKIKEISFFSKLSEDSLIKLDQISVFKSFNAGEIVFYEGDAPGYLYILLEGVLRLYKTDAKANEVYIHQFTPTAMIGEIANFQNMNYPASAKFITKGTVLKIDFKKLEKKFFQHPDISMEIIKSLTKKVKILANVLHKELILTSEAKVAKFICENSELYAKLKNVQIASMLNITPETLSRILTKFKKLNYITISDSHHVTIGELDLLKAFYK